MSRKIEDSSIMGNKFCCCKGRSNSLNLEENKDDEAANKYKEATVLVVGNISVGKTTLINCMIKNEA